MGANRTRSDQLEQSICGVTQFADVGTVERVGSYRGNLENADYGLLPMQWYGDDGANSKLPAHLGVDSRIPPAIVTLKSFTDASTLSREAEVKIECGAQLRSRVPGPCPADDLRSIL